MPHYCHAILQGEYKVANFLLSHDNGFQTFRDLITDAHNNVNSDSYQHSTRMYLCVWFQSSFQLFVFHKAIFSAIMFVAIIKNSSIFDTINYRLTVSTNLY